MADRRRSPAAWAAVAAGLALVGGATVFALRGPAASACPATSGGESGTEAQLRYVDVGEGQVTFTFGPSAASDVFGVPRFTVTETAVGLPPELDTGTHRLSVAFAGASEFNPDLSSSYQGATLLVPPGDGLVREAVVTGDSGRQMSWAVVLGSARCPEVTTHAYVWGKSPRAQVTLTFAQRAWITAEHPATYVGSPILAPVLVTGLGFVPRSPLTVRLAGEVVTTADADDKGGVEASFFVPKRQPGVYELSVSDATGRRASRPLTITDER